HGRLDLELSSSVAANITGWLADKLDTAGVPEHRVVVDGKTVHIYFKKEIAPLVIIAAAIAASIIIFTLLVSWKLYQLSAPAVVATIFGIPILIIVIIVVAIILIVYIGGRVKAGAVTIGR
ncbi:unnamed protein product, partial [marine sediment metagenome]